MMGLLGTILYFVFYGSGIIALVIFAVPAYRYPQRFWGFIDITLVCGVLICLESLLVEPYLLPLVGGALAVGIAIAVKRRQASSSEIYKVKSK
jgi:hypothetical protein